MGKRTLFIFLLCWAGYLPTQAQTDFQQRKVAVGDSIRIEEVSINPDRFQVLDAQGEPIDSTLYEVDFGKGILILKDSLKAGNDSITIQYRKYPDFLTRSYYQFDPKVITDGSLSQRL